MKYDLFSRNPPSCYAANEHNKFSKTFFGSSKQSLLKAMMYSVLLCGQIPSLPVISLFFFFFLRPLLISSSFNEQLILLHLASTIVLIFRF